MIHLEKVNIKHKDKIPKFKEEFIKNNETIIPGGELLDETDSIDEWIEHVNNNSKKESLPSDWVLTDCFLALNDKDEIVGIISLRYYLNDFLKDLGHIGFSVSPSHRRKKIATQMLKEVIKKAKHNGLTKLQISAHDDNIASIRTIEKAGGKYQRQATFMDKPLNIYTMKL